MKYSVNPSTGKFCFIGYWCLLVPLRADGLKISYFTCGPFRNSTSIEAASCEVRCLVGVMIEWIRSPIFNPCRAADEFARTLATMVIFAQPAGRNPKPVSLCLRRVIFWTWLRPGTDKSPWLLDATGCSSSELSEKSSHWRSRISAGVVSRKESKFRFWKWVAQWVDRNENHASFSCFFDSLDAIR